MSVRTMARVWAHSKQSGTALLMMLAIADFADDDGNAYPSVATLAAKCRMQPRNSNYILRALQASGELVVRENEGPRGTNLYRIALGVQELAGVQGVAGVQSTVATPAVHGRKPLQPIADEPSLTHQEPSESARRRATPAPKTPTCRTRAPRTAIPEDFAISELVKIWAAERGFDRLADHLEAFKLKAAAKGYEYADWDAAFMVAVTDDWARLRSSRSSGGTNASPPKRSALHADDVIEVPQ